MADRIRSVVWYQALHCSGWCLLILVSLAAASQPLLVNAQDSDTEFLEFENKNVPSPQQLLEHLNRLRGVNLQIGGTGPNGLPGDQAFQEWVTKDLLPSLDKEQQEQLKEIARKMRDRQLGGQTAYGGSEEGSAEPGDTSSPLKALREELRQNPELEASLRERLEQRPENSPLSNLLGDAETNQRDGQSEGLPNPRGLSSDPSNQGQLQRQGQSEGTRGAGSRPLKEGEVEGADVGEDPGSLGGRAGNQGNRGGNASADESAASRQADATVPRRDPSTNPGASLPGDEVQGLPQGTDSNGAGIDDQSDLDGQGNGRPDFDLGTEEKSGSEFLGDGDRERNARPDTALNNSFRPSRPGRGTFGNARSEPNPNRSTRQPSPNDPARRGSSPEPSNGQVADPNESFRDRLNRILLEAANDSTVEESQAEGGEGKKKNGALNGFLNDIASRFQESMRDPERRRQFQESIEQQRRAAATRRITSPRGLSRGSDLLSDSGGMGLLGMVLLIGAFTFVVVMFFSTPIRDRMFGVMAQYSSGLRQARGYQVPEITSTRQLVEAIDRFVFWRFGLGAHWWHGGYVHQQLAEAHPHRIIEIDQLLDAYETARYSPASQTLDEQRFAAAARCLQNLKDETLAQMMDHSRADARLASIE